MLTNTIQSIMATDLYTWNPDEKPQKDIVKFALDKEFDTIPVVRNSKIDGLFHVDEAEIKSLTPDLMLTRDTPIADALHLLSMSKHPAFLVLYRQEIQGILTPSDFNKITARSYFYSILAELEMNLANHIRKYYQDENEVDEYKIAEIIKVEGKTTAQYRRDIRKRTSAETRSKYRLDFVHNLLLSEMETLLTKDSDFRSHLGFGSEENSRTLFDGINRDFRRNVMHANRKVLADEYGIEALSDMVQRVLKIIEILESAPDASQFVGEV